MSIFSSKWINDALEYGDDNYTREELLEMKARSLQEDLSYSTSSPLIQDDVLEKLMWLMDKLQTTDWVRKDIRDLWEAEKRKRVK